MAIPRPLAGPPRFALLTLALLLVLARSAHAATELTASPATPVAGEEVTFTLTTTRDCSCAYTSTSRRALSRLALINDAFTLEAADAVLGYGALDAVQGLVDQSLLSVRGAAGGVRYRMLETVRQFGRLQLESAGEECEECEARAAGLGDRVRGPPSPRPVRPRPVHDDSDGDHARQGLVRTASRVGAVLVFAMLAAWLQLFISNHFSAILALMAPAARQE